MQNTNQRTLTFPQRNWLLLCILAAIASGVSVNWMHNAAEKKVYQQSVEVKPKDTSGRDSSNQLKSPPSSGGANQKTKADSTGGDSGSKLKSPPASGGAKKSADSAKH